MTVRADADTYVYENTPTTNYGTANVLEIKQSTGTHEREAYLRFSLTEVASVSVAKLRLFGRVHANGADTSDVTLAAFASYDTGWVETDPTWNDRLVEDTEELLTLAIGYNSGTDKWWDFDVSGYVAELKASGATAVTFILKGDSASDPKAVFRSDEHTSNRPELVLTPVAGFEQDGNGLVSIEAEHYSHHVSQGGKNWTSVTSPSGYSGTAAMQALTNTGVGPLTAANALTQSPRMDFAVNFNRTGTHYVWVRGHGPSGDDDSIHVGLNGAAVSTSDNIRLFSTSGYGWESTADSARLTVNIATTGIHILNLWFREDGSVVDKIVIEDSSGYTPTGSGPAETLAAPIVMNAAAFSDELNLPGIGLLSAFGDDDRGASGLTYTWEATTKPTGATVGFSDSGTTAAHATVVTLDRAGSYSFRATISDGLSTTTTTVNKTVTAAVANVLIDQGGVALKVGESQGFTATAIDQFGQVMSPTPTVTWSIVSGGVGTLSGASYSSSSPGEATIKAVAGGVEATVPVKVGHTVGRVFDDKNEDGDQDVDEPGLEGWTIYLDGSGLTDETNAYGDYALSEECGAVSGDLRATPRDGWDFSDPANGVHVGVEVNAANQLRLNFGAFADARTIDWAAAKYTGAQGQVIPVTLTVKSNDVAVGKGDPVKFRILEGGQPTDKAFIDDLEVQFKGKKDTANNGTVALNIRLKKKTVADLDIEATASDGTVWTTKLQIHEVGVLIRPGNANPIALNVGGAPAPNNTPISVLVSNLEVAGQPGVQGVEVLVLAANAGPQPFFTVAPGLVQTGNDGLAAFTVAAVAPGNGDVRAILLRDGTRRDDHPVQVGA